MFSSRANKSQSLIITATLLATVAATVISTTPEYTLNRVFAFDRVVASAITTNSVSFSIPENYVFRSGGLTKRLIPANDHAAMADPRVHNMPKLVGFASAGAFGISMTAAVMSFVPAISRLSSDVSLLAMLFATSGAYLSSRLSFAEAGD